jgi:RNA polymerase sigma factor (sigma-70 family)
MSAVLGHVRRLLVGPGSDLTDRQLLERFALQHDEAAFAALVRRHGRMVLGVCRRVLRHEQDAEDAFQAAFLVLARQTGAVRKGEAVGSWLFRVAYRAALKMRAAARKRRLVERRAPAVPRAADLTEMPLWELRAILDEELRRLPEKYRAPAVLCYLEGNTQEEAACRLGWTLRAVKSRLERARQLLRTRLGRRGLALSGGLLGACLAENALAAALPSTLVNGTARGALCFAAERAAVAGPISKAAVAVAEGVIRTMALTKAKTLATVLLVLGVVGAGAGVGIMHTLADGRPAGTRQSAPGANPAPQAAEPDRADALSGTLVPETRRWVYAPVEGRVKKFAVRPNAQVQGGQQLIEMEDLNLQMGIHKLQGEIRLAQVNIQAVEARVNDIRLKPEERARASADRIREQAVLEGKRKELKALLQRTNAVPATPGLFWINAPPLPAAPGRKEPPVWTVLNSDFEENLTSRVVKPCDPLLRLGDTSGNWEAELKIPLQRVGRVLHAFGAGDPPPKLDVDLVLASAPLRVFKGKLTRDGIAGEVLPGQVGDGKEPETIVWATIRVADEDIPLDERIPRSLRLAGGTVRCKIHDGGPGGQGKAPP